MPVATERLLYIPMPFTGEVWVQSVLRNCGAVLVPNAAPFAPLVEVPATWREDRLAFGSCRDPWSWYQALWVSLTADPDGQVLLRHLGRGRTTFPAFIDGVTDSSVWMSAPQRLTLRLWDWPVGTEGGLFSATLKTFYDDDSALLDAVVDYANIEAGLSEILGIKVTGSNKDAAFGLHKAANPYNKAMTNLVTEADGEVATMLGYDGFASRMNHPVRWGGFS